MKVIKDNSKKNNSNIFPLKVVCENCSSELELEESDCYIGPFGAYYYTCPCCGDKVMLNEPEGITLTKDNLEFPTHYWHYGNGYEVTEEEINTRVKEMIEDLRTNKSDDDYGFLYTAFGDTFMLVKRYPSDEEYYVVVAKNFYDANVQFETEDYV